MSLPVLLLLFIIAAAAAAIIVLSLKLNRCIKENRNLKLIGERYRLAAEQTNSVIFDYNITSNILNFSPAFKEKFGYEPPLRGFPESIVDARMIFSEDIADFLQNCHRCINGKQHSKLEIRIRKSDGEYVWCILRMTCLVGSDGEPSRILAKISDIDSSKRQTELLAELCERDCLTSFYNRDAAKGIISRSIDSSDPHSLHALMIIDIDNFKTINDVFGHLKGDSCLLSVKDAISAGLDNNAVLARVGGDEFLAFIPNISSADHAYECGKKICESVRSNCAIITENEKLAVTTSIGVAAMNKNDGASYQTLFERADAAMYLAKRSGKNSCKM